MPTLKMKRGDTFACTGVRRGADKLPESVTPYAIRVQIRSGNPARTLLATPVIVKLTPQAGATLGMFTLGVAASETSAWEVGTYVFDIEFTHTDASRNSTETITLKVLEDITRE